MVPLQFIRTDLSFFVVNVYNRGSSERHHTVEALLQAQFPVTSLLIIGGDFNLRHRAWSLSSQPQYAHSELGEQLTVWAASHNLLLLNDLDQPTHRGHQHQADSIIDLTWSAATDTFASYDWDVSDQLRFGSDHRAISWTTDLIIPQTDEPELDLGYRIDPEKRKDWTDTLNALLTMNPPPEAYHCMEDLDRGADVLIGALHAAICEAMPPRKN
ncbi:uncharacterized protein LAESUDRAFT_756346 [Laetiporus sulphureus 93-53]|uniref:Endonuclease/exonuclease/phosphatase domain-containing protein n=1 Tax=Laetiporus sulphureus 93-53 TaxID=1314785 RepID=A0A165GCF1_9APHY|nr:uncharacterized protein LAESUDRAFT_756346 [Laetiporus sulphureus 93-53]KZT10154.1 hypothetical protein LAESUDRAFT_756346 [Laetiporus sulphureus 93-53]